MIHGMSKKDYEKFSMAAEIEGALREYSMKYGFKEYLKLLIDSHINIRGWSRLDSAGDLLFQLGKEYKIIGKRVNR